MGGRRSAKVITRKLELIANERSRNTTFKKRTKGLKKKAYEFSTLCDVDACLIIYGPNNKQEPEIWPENRHEVLNIINKFRKQHRTEGGGPRGKLQHIGIAEFWEDEIKKLHCELAKLIQSNNNNNNNNNKAAAAAMYPTTVGWVERINNFSEDQINILSATLKSKVELLKLKTVIAEADQYLMDDGDDDLPGLIIEESVDLTEAEKYLLLDDNDVTGLIEEYSVPPLNQNPPPPYTNSSSYSSIMMDDMHMHHHHQSSLEMPAVYNNAGGGGGGGGGGEPLLYCYDTTDMMMHPYFSPPQQLQQQVNENISSYLQQDYQGCCNFTPNIMQQPMTMHSYLQPPQQQLQQQINENISSYLQQDYQGCCNFSPNIMQQPMTMHSYLQPPQQQLHHQFNEFPHLQGYQVNTNGVATDYSSTFHPLAAGGF